MARPPTGEPPVGQSAVARTDQNPNRKDLANYQTIAEAFERPDRRESLRAMLGGDDDLVERFLAVALNAIATDSDLLSNADPISIIQAVRDSATLGLEPTGLTGEAVIIRYGRQAKLMPMYRGYLKRIRNTGKVEVITAKVVYANDEFDYGYDVKGAWYTHHPARPSNPTGLDAEGNSERGEYWGAYCFWRYTSGYQDIAVMPAVEVNYIRDTFSKAGTGGAWDTSWGEMAIKTVVRRAAKLLPQSSAELADAVNPLLAMDNALDDARAADEANRVDVTRSRRAALAAIAARGTGVPALAALEAPEDASEPVEVEATDEPPPLDDADLPL